MLMDWTMLGKARKAENKGFNVAITKLYSGNFGCNATPYKWSMEGNNKCPRCGREGEDLQHILACKQAEAKKFGRKK